MVEQYPDILEVVGTDRKYSCRFRPAKGSRFVRTMDGSDIIAKFEIAFPEGTDDLQEGMIITGHDRSGKIIGGAYEVQLLNFHIGQLHSVGII